MEECLPHFLIRVFVVPSRVVKRAKQFIPPSVFGTALHQLGQENPHRVVVGNRKPMRMLSHDCTSILRIVFVLASPISKINLFQIAGHDCFSTAYSRYFRAFCGVSK
jgi:hypothetical protein